MATMKELRSLARGQGIDPKGMSREDLEFSVDVPAPVPERVLCVLCNATKAVHMSGWGRVYLSAGSKISGELAEALHAHHPDDVTPHIG